MGWSLTFSLILLECIHSALAYPLPQDELDREGRRSGSEEYMGVVIGAATILCSITILLACVCCKRSGFKELDSVSSRVAGSTSTINQHGPQEEFTMFPPPGISQLSMSTTHINFEPLPDIRPRSGSRRDQRITDKTLPASFPNQVLAGLPTDEWFAEPHQNFPRNQLQYVKEIGKGWFGHVLEGRATGIYSDHTKGDSPVSSSLSPSSLSRGQTPVAVKVLREDATPTEQMYFLHELRPYRDLTHPNVLKVLAQCLETEPFLILLQLCPKGDLKAVVRNDKKLTDAALLRMILDVASGLQHMHANNFIHTDLAARNCVVDEDYTVKIGDYGYNIDFYKAEYYCAGEVALPLRWCSPETLKCTDTTIETKEVTKPANVWSFGVIMWEIASRGLMPYTNLDDDRVIQDVIIDHSTILEPPKGLELHAEKIYNIMKLSWSPVSSRPPIDHLTSLLSHLWENQSVTSHDATSMNDFEFRWNQLQQRQSHNHSITHGANTLDLRFESDFNLSTPYGGHMSGALSPSLQNLHGSVEDLDAKMAAKFGSAMPSWLGMEPGQPMDSLTREITDAILKLDDYLAGEKSEPSTAVTSPEKDGVNFKLGKDSFVSHPPESKLVHAMSGSGHPSLTRSLSEGDEEGFTMRLEQGEFTEMVRLKSQSVQDFMRLTVVDDGSDSDNASQRNSLAFEPVNKPLASEKSYSSEGNIREALRDVRFMGDLERLQAEHKYSIITEASRENPSSIEFRGQEYNFDKPLSTSDIQGDFLEAGSTDKLATSVDSDNSNIFSDKQNGEQDPFLGEVISSACTEERIPNAYPIPGKESESSSGFVNNSVVPKALSASPDFVVSSREKKPIALPDIVVHDSSVKLSTPSPPPEDSPVKVVNASQPKEFRVVFAENISVCDSNVNNEKGSESVSFSENIKENKLQASLCEADKNQRADDMGKKNKQSGEFVNSVKREEPTSKKEEIIKFLDFVQENPRLQLSSTPLKPPSFEVAPQVLGSDEHKIIEEMSSSEESSLENSDNEESGDFSSGVVGVDPDNSGVKQRLVFGYQSERSRKDSGSSSHSSSSSNDSSSDIESSDEEDCENENNNVESGKSEAPSYKPEQVIKGEEVVIGALEDYSLDLFKAVKSTAPNLPTSHSNKTECDTLLESSKDGISHVDNIEYDLEKWDEFLGDRLNQERCESDVIFKESSTSDFDIKMDDSNDLLGETFNLTSTGAKQSGFNSQAQFEKTEKSILDLSSTFEHSTCGEIQNILKDDSIEQVADTSRPTVNTDLFFGDSDSTISIGKGISQENGMSESSKPLSSSEVLGVYDQVQSKSNDSFFTVVSPSVVTEFESLETSESFQTPASKMVESHIISSRSVVQMSEKDNESSSLECSATEKGRNSDVLGNESSCVTDTLDSFTYKRELSVDNSCDILEGIATNNKAQSFVRAEVSQSPSAEVVKSGEVPGNLSSTGESGADKDEVDSASFTRKVNETFVVCEDSTSSTTQTLDKKGLEPKETKAPDVLNLENIGSVTSTESAQLILKSFGPATQTNLILRDDDDLSPSAYQGKFKAGDCWSSRESQDSAVEPDEAENGEFWQQQMMAWQQAAFQTRQLLQQATCSGSDATLASLKSSREDLEASPTSDTSSSKSPYSSTDMLNLDDEGTYVSYNTTDDEEVLGYKPEDINALRAELSLKLGGLQDERDQLEPSEPDDPSAGERENVVINYRGIVTTTLSPIKEESFLDEDDSPVRKVSRSNSSSGFPMSVSLELEEPLKNMLSQCAEKGSDTFVIKEEVNCDADNKGISLSEFAFAEDLDETEDKESGTVNTSLISSPVIRQDATTTSEVSVDGKEEPKSLENTHNSLILEDLENENGPSSIQIYEGDDVDADDVLVVDTITNEATIVEGGIPRSHLAFMTDKQQPDPSDVQPFPYDDSDDVALESIPSVSSSRFDELRHQEQLSINKASWDSHHAAEDQTCNGGSESKPGEGLVNGFVTSDENIDGGKENSENYESPQGIQVPHYHSYFTSALSTISHPSASLEEPPLFEPVEHISLPYDVNYPAAGEHLQSLDDVSEKEEEEENKQVSDDEEDELESERPIKLNFLGRLYSGDSEELNGTPAKTSIVGEPPLAPDLKEGTSTAKMNDAEASDLSDLNKMTSAEFLASKKYQINDNEDIEEHIVVEPGYEEDSDDDDDGMALTPGKLSNVQFRMNTRDPCYTPDWESDSESDEESSSTSGEFMWKEDEEKHDGEDLQETKPGEECQQSNYTLDVIEEEAEDGDYDDGCSDDSESGEEEFTPSKWNRDLTPSHSLLKSPQNKSSLKKSVRWKRQRHHRVYEYPPEPRSWEPTPTESHHRRSWGRSSLDYLSLADWDLGDDFVADDSGDMDDYVYRKPTRPAPPPPIYTLGSIAYDDTAEGFLEENGEFFIRSSGSPFTFTSSSFSASDFFPGTTYYSEQDHRDILPDPIADEIASEMAEPHLIPDSSQSGDSSSNLHMNKYLVIDDEMEQSSPTNTGLGQLRHTRDKLRLEIPTISVASDGTKVTGAFTLGSEQSEYGNYSGQDISSAVKQTRSEPEVSEV
ncbi:uncharacterized protein [Macrobrachium rosenbergii]|uniref:uncharacterized protein isoform X1 n=1 Tax=Macrobrachium rosenbergii TaxID=79674 RepID=UPI0034D5839D